MRIEWVPLFKMTRRDVLNIHQAPPQLWELHSSHKRGVPSTVILRHTYMPKVPTAFAGFPATFGGPQDELVLRVGSGK